jgi:transcriptional regulator with XRE-family HTH domain
MPDQPVRDPRGMKPNHRRRQRILYLWRQGLTLTEIGKRFGCSRQNVAVLLKGANGGTAPPLQLRCPACGKVTEVTAKQSKLRRPVYCLPCLATRPRRPFADRLRAFRLSHGLSRRALAQASGLCLRTIEETESGVVQPGWRVLGKLARVFGLVLLLPEGGEDV